MADNLLSELTNLRKLFAEVAPEDPKVISNYAWTIIKVILLHCSELGSTTARQLLADCIKLPLQRPSRVYSALLAAAVKVYNTYPDFHFAIFLRMWDISNFLVEDNEPQMTQEGTSIPPLVGRAAKALGSSLLLYSEDASSPTSSTPSPPMSDSHLLTLPPSFAKLLTFCGYSIHSMLVTRIKQAEGKDGRKYVFVTLTSPEGIEVETVSQSLHPSPLRPLPAGKRHYVNIGQFYDCLLRTKQHPASTASGASAESSSLSLKVAYLSPRKPSDIFPTTIGYVESIDQQHGHMHIYDSYSRHLVAPVQRFSRERVGDFVRFIPIVPAASKFKTAIILSTIPAASPEVQTHLREICITHINKEKGYAAWELTDKTQPITELLSPLQLSQGETSPSFTSGYLNLLQASERSSSFVSNAPVSGTSSSLGEGQKVTALIYLKRGKDKQKRPHVACIF